MSNLNWKWEESAKPLEPVSQTGGGMKALLPEGEAQHVWRGQDMVPAAAEDIPDDPAGPFESSAPESKLVLLLQNTELSMFLSLHGKLWLHTYVIFKNNVATKGTSLSWMFVAEKVLLTLYLAST